MLDLIRNINGQQFLVIYFVFAALITVCAKVFLNSLTKADVKKFELDIYSLSVLKNRKNSGHLLETILFKLWTDKYIEIKADSSNGEVKICETDKPASGLSAEENKVLELVKVNHDGKKILKEYRILDDYRYKLLENLFDAGLINDAEMMKVQKRCRMVFYLLMLSLGLVKLYMGVVYSRPSSFLVFELVFFSIAFFAVNSVSELTKLGNRVLKKKISENSWVRTYNSRKGFNGDIDRVASAVAVMGLASIAVIPDYGAFAAIVPPPPVNMGSGSSCSSSSCSSSSCSSSSCSSSSCSSSSCSSSSCSSGGCGGCGGGN
ncbi:MAG TPA: TIGR04222 domain-containing membrane protein [Clostridia bacterium]